MTLADEVKAAAEAHGTAEYPRESCGLVVIFKGRQQYHACRNIGEGTDQFAMHPEDYADADAKARSSLLCIRIQTCRRYHRRQIA